MRSEGQLRSQVAALSLCQEVSGFDGTRYRGTMCGVYAQFVPTRVLRERGPEVTPEEDAVNTRETGGPLRLPIRYFNEDSMLRETECGLPND